MVTQVMSREGARQKSLKRHQWRTDFGEAQPAAQQEKDRLMQLYGESQGEAK